MTATQTTLIWLNLAGAFAAMLTNARAAATPHPRDRFEFGMAATLATLFAVAMVVQLMAVTVTEVAPAPDRGQITEWSLTTGGPITPWPPRCGQITEWSLFRRPGTGWHVGRVVW